MGRIRTFTRRAFLVGSVAVAGGVAFGTYMVRKPHANPLADGLAEGEATFNPWVRIGPDGVTLIAPHTDLGQGVRSVQAALIAEELDIDPAAVTVETGVPSPAYYNAGLADEGVPFMPQDDSFPAQMARGAVGGVMKVLGMQVTGGSSTIPDSFDKLRHAGAVARETLKAAAAQRTGVAASDLKTGDGAVILPDGTAIRYEDLAAEAAQIPPVTDVALRSPEDWRLIGKPMQRLDILPKSTGTAEYGIDLQMEGMLNATVRFNPRQGGALNGYDASAAETMPGVRQVLPVTGGAAVIADNTWNAFQAANAIDFDWGPAPYPAEQQGHWDEIAASFTDERLDKEWRHDGDVPAALGQGAALEAEYRCPYAAHAPLEPIGATILVTDARVDIWVGHQMPIFARDMVARITGHEADQVHLHNLYVGGSFGHRLEFENVRYAAEIGTQLKGTPVKLTFSREEDFAHDYPRQIGMARGTGTVADGKVTAMDLSIATPSASASQFGRLGMAMPGPDAQIVSGAWNMPYDLPALRVRGYRVPELAPTSSWRSVGAVTAGFFAESLLDELIHAAGADPVQERLRLCNWDVARKTLEAAAEMSNWGTDLGEGRAMGVAMVVSFGVPVAEVVQVAQTDRGLKIEKVWVAADVGRVVDPVNFENLVQGGVVWGLGHAMNAEITYSDGMAQQTNYHAHEGMRMHQCPEIHVRGLENGHVRGIGEPPVPPAAPALANAIFAATGQRLREMPFHNHVTFA
ncbi:xanthine dehydrogenase family protein molybdopterin-binding subunit [Halovulum sp. GXIMD14794]